MKKKIITLTLIGALAVSGSLLAGCSKSATPAPSDKAAVTSPSPSADPSATPAPAPSDQATKPVDGTGQPAPSAKPDDKSAPTQPAQSTSSKPVDKPPGQYGDDMQKVVNAIFLDAQVQKAMVDASKDPKAKWGLIFKSNDKGESTPVNNKWEVTLTLDSKAIDTIVVSQGDFKVLSVNKAS